MEFEEAIVDNSTPTRKAQGPSLCFSKARKAAGLSQEKLGVLAGIDEMSASARMNQYERGKHAPDYSMVERIASNLNLPVTYFFSADDSEAKLLVAYHRLRDEDKDHILSQALEMIRTDK